MNCAICHKETYCGLELVRPVKSGRPPVGPDDIRSRDPVQSERVSVCPDCAKKIAQWVSEFRVG